MIGTTISDRYLINDQIGKGGMGTVYLAYDSTLKRDVALKVMSETKLDTQGRTRLLYEAQLVAGLNHFNIVTIHDAGEMDSTTRSEKLPYVVMELIEGQSLREMQPKDLEEIVAIASQICAALDHAHTNDIVHRDLKPENVMIEADGTVKLMDFGLARSIASRMTVEGRIVGTVFYLAPELAMGQEYDGRVDLYALGVMLYELTTGELPFMADDPVAVISQHLHAPVVPPRAKNDEVPPALDYLIVGLLKKDPHDRPTSAKEVFRALESPDILDVKAAPGREYSMLERIVRGRMVGREKEMEEARTLWTRTKEGEGQLLLISGEPGIGKTRLMREIVTEAEVSGGQVLIGASYAEGGAPYGAFKQIIRETLSNGDFELPRNTLAELLILTPELQHHFPDLPDLEQTDPQSEQQRFLESMVILCASLGDRAPLLLVLEDAHWADSGTLSMLRHLSRNTRHQRVMIIATYREVELDEARPFHEVLLDLDRERLAMRIKLKRLNPDQTRSMLAILFSEGITPEFLKGIYHETEGNPFFIEEVCKALVDSGKLYYEEGQWQRPSIEELGIPQSVRVAIQSRVVKLPDEYQETLQMAAILGREFDFETLTRASDLDEDTLINALDSAQRSLLIEEMSTDGREIFAFAHALIPASLIESSRMVKRRRLHRRAAAAIEELWPDDFEALAYHNIQSGQLEKGVKYLLQAGDRARGLYAHQEAIESYEQAIELLEEGGDHELTARTLMKLGLTHHNAFEFDKSRRAYEQGFIYWQRVGKANGEIQPAPHPLKVVSGVPPTLDPSRAYDGESIAIINQLFSGLGELSPNMSVMPDIAHSWEVFEGGRKYIFHLRDDVYWSDGVQVSAKDFEYAWFRALDPDPNPFSARLLYVIKGARLFHQGKLHDRDQVGVQAHDDLTFVVELEEPTSYFLQLLSSTVAFPVPRHVVERHGEAWTDMRNIVTNGPFTLVSLDRNGAVFERNPAYHGRFSGNLEQVDLSFLDRQASYYLQLYENDLLDFFFLSGLLPTEAERARQQYAGEYVSGPRLGVTYLGFDVSRRPFDDPRVRRAIALATNRERLASVVNKGFEFPATGGLVPPGMPGHSPKIALPYDPDQARKLLAEADYPGGHRFPELECLTPMYSWVSTNEFLQTQWREVLGIEINWRFMEWGKFLDRVITDTPNLWLMGYHADYPDPDNILRESEWQWSTHWKRDTYERLVDEARKVTDQEERMKLYNQADLILIEEAPVIPLAYFRYHILVKPWVKKLIISAMNPLFCKDIIIDPH